MWLIVAVVALMALSGAPALVLPRRSAAAGVLAALLMLLASAAGLYAAGCSLAGGPTLAWQHNWLIPWGKLALRLDPLSAFFLLPIMVAPALGSFYGLGYWPARKQVANIRRVLFFYGMLAGAMALVVVARDAVLLLIAWEVMALSAFFLATASDDDPQACRSGWIYLVATHTGTLCLICCFGLLYHATGSFALDSIDPARLSPTMASTILILGLIGFGFKAGLMPLHVWLPGAHANAPSHVSAVMSGVMLKMGIYGIVRLTAMLPAGPPWWGGMLLTVGGVTAVGGIAFALGQQDLKRLLAYSSIENMGIVMLGLGLAVLGRSVGRNDWIVLGLAGALLHALNHSLFKPLLFFAAGALIHATGTRQIDQLGGLLKKMPLTGGLFILAAMAICALPPLNGFAGEILIYLGLMHSAADSTSAAAAALAGPVLALVGALALLCFVKLVAAAFLGEPRSSAGDNAHDPPLAMLLPMLILAACCLAVGLFPQALFPMLSRATQTWSGATTVAAAPLISLAPLGWITALGLALLALLGAGALTARYWKQTRALVSGTWGCGYLAPTPRIQYTGASFTQTMVDLFSWALWPRKMAPRLRALFPAVSGFEREFPDTVLDRLVLPSFRALGQSLAWLRLLQQGRVQVYLLYIVVILLVLYCWA